MAKHSAHSNANAAAEVISAAERNASEHAEYSKKLKARLVRATKTLEVGAGVVATLRTLISDLQKLPAPVQPDHTRLMRDLDNALKDAQRSVQDDLPANLRAACEATGLSFKALPDGYGIGPFLVTVNVLNETATVTYARSVVREKLSTSPNTIVDVVTQLKSAIIECPLDCGRFRSELHEAVRVALARQENRSAKAQSRVDLPILYRELALIRHFPIGAQRRSDGNEYTLARFIVELKKYMQSDVNVKSEQPFQLEPAVIENTKNPKKSIFIPRDIACGFGEGTYYQAIVLRSPT